MNEEELADHYDRTDLTDEITRASWESETDPDPMVVTSLRLPKSLLDWIRDEAAADHTRPTALIRRWLEQRRSEQSSDDVTLTDLAARVDRLESVTLEVARSARTEKDVTPTASDSMTDLLAALQRSVDDAREGSQERRGSEGGSSVPGDEHRRGA
jgi:hypothetical protein